MNAIPTSKGLMTPGAIVDELTYINYAFNRERSPHITPARWAKVYPRAAELEARYQAEKAIDNARRVA